MRGRLQPRRDENLRMFIDSFYFKLIILGEKLDNNSKV